MRWTYPWICVTVSTQYSQTNRSYIAYQCSLCLYLWLGLRVAGFLTELKSNHNNFLTKMNTASLLPSQTCKTQTWSLKWTSSISEFYPTYWPIKDNGTPRIISILITKTRKRYYWNPGSLGQKLEITWNALRKKHLTFHSKPFLYMAI